MRFPTRLVGDATPIKGRTLSAGPCKLVAVMGDNSGGPCRIQIYASVTGTEPLTLQGTGTALHDFDIAGDSQWSFALPAVEDLDSCHVVASSTRTTHTPIALPTVTVQGVLAA